MLRKTLKPSHLVVADWSQVFGDKGLAVAAAALVRCLVALGDSFELLFEMRDLRDVSGATVKLDSILSFVEKQDREGRTYLVTDAFLQYAARFVPFHSAAPKRREGARAVA